MMKAIFPLLAITLLTCSKKEVALTKPEHLEAELIAEVTSIKPGQPFWVALKLEMEENWHVNWRNPGDAGLTPTITWALPEGFTAGEINWPIPKRLPVGDLMLFGYEGTVLLPVKITPASTIAGNEITLSAACDWVVCGEVCIPGEAELSMKLPVKEETPKIDNTHAVDFASTRNESPNLNEHWNLNAAASEETILISAVLISGQDQIIESMEFFPEVQGIINNAAQQRFSQDRIGYKLEIDRDQMFPNIPEKLKGVIVFKSEKLSAEKGVVIEVPLTREISLRN